MSVQGIVENHLETAKGVVEQLELTHDGKTSNSHAMWQAIVGELKDILQDIQKEDDAEFFLKIREELMHPKIAGSPLYGWSKERVMRVLLDRVRDGSL